MRLVVFGASKGVGRLVAELALTRGDQVTAFSRRGSGMAPSANLIERRGDVLNPEAVMAAVAGQDAVIIALGPGSSGPQDRTRSQGTAHILQAMKQQGVRRLVALSSFGVGDSRRGLVGNLVWLFLRTPLQEHQRQENLIQQSGLDWTVVRPTGLTNDPPRGSYLEGRFQQGRISRADVASFMLKTVADPAYVGRAQTLDGLRG